MANGLDRFERLFSKRRPAPSRNTTASNVNNGSAPSASAQSGPPSPDPPVFPEAPFIRPKTNASRMHARDEPVISTSRSTAPTSSSDSRTCSWRLSSSDARAMSDHRRQSSHSSTTSFSVPSRNSSLLARRHDRKPGGLVHLNIPGETTTIIKPSPYLVPKSPRSLPRSPRFGPSPAPVDAKAVQKCLLEALPIYPGQRYETPPPSDQDEIHFSSPPSARGRLPSLALSHFTPEHSPDMIPRRDSTLSEPKTSTDLNRKSLTAPPSRRATSIASSAALLSDDWRDSYVPLDAAVETTSRKTKSIIQELPVRDFMTLTDEDIAEVKTKAPSEPPARLPPPPPVLPPNIRNTRSPPFLPTRRAAGVTMTRPPPLAPDEVAAFQAARIAKKYDFDFLYVVNFWPSRMSHHLVHRPAGTAAAAGPRGLHSSHARSGSAASSSATSCCSSSRPPSTLYSPTTSDRPTTKNSTPRNSLQAPHAPSSSEGGAGSSNHHHHHAAATACCCCCRPSGPGSPRGGMTGRLLTGYGLNTLEAPFRLSARAHRKILREGHDGWIEYRKSDAGDNEFARGYARSFYTGHAAGSGAQASDDDDDDNSNDSHNNHTTNNNKKKKQNYKTTAARRPPAVDRGIVFAAYRRPRNHGGTVHSGAAELDALEREAETLVELILDFHQVRRRWEFYQEAVMTE